MKVLVRQPRPTHCRKKERQQHKVAKIIRNIFWLPFFLHKSRGVESSRLDALLNAIGVSCLVHAMSDHIYTSIYPYLCLVFASKINNLLARRFFVLLFSPFFSSVSSLLIFLSYTRFSFTFVGIDRLRRSACSVFFFT